MSDINNISVMKNLISKFPNSEEWFANQLNNIKDMDQLLLLIQSLGYHIEIKDVGVEFAAKLIKSKKLFIINSNITHSYAINETIELIKKNLL